MENEQLSEWGRWWQARRIRTVSRCIRCGESILGYPGKLRCAKCKKQAAQERRKARRKGQAKMGNIAHKK